LERKEQGIYKRGNRYVVIYRDGTGRQRKQAAATLAEARKVRAQRTLDPGSADAVSRELFRDYARRWVDTCPGRTKNGLREVTRDKYREKIELAIPIIGNVRMCDLRAVHLDRLAEEIAKRKGIGADRAAPNTLRLALAPVKSMLADAAQRGDILRNPATGWRTRYTQPTTEVVDGADATVIEEKAKALSEEELAALLAAIPEEHRFLFIFLAQTGLRIGEAVELRGKDLDLGRKRFEVRRRFYIGTIAPPKSKYGRRTIRLSENTAKELWRRQIAPEDLIFTSVEGKRINQKNVQRRILNVAAKKAGLVDSKGEPWPTFHTFRHTCASVLFRAGWNAKQVQAWLGHHSPAFTLGVYVHLLPDDLPDPSFLDALEGGNKGATQPAETHRDDHVSTAVETASNLVVARAV
jgi:integrase